MKKQLVCFIAILALLIQVPSCVFAKVDNVTSIAIKKYKRGNYTGCLQDCQNIVQSHGTNAVAYYYMAMSYVQAGKKDEAINAYSMVLSLRPSSQLSEYAQTGKRCLETPDRCRLVTNVVSAPSTTPDIDKLIASPYFESPAVRQDLRQKQLNSIKNDINSDKELDDYSFRKLNKVDPNNLIAQAKPSDAEVVAALKTLKDAGISPYSQQTLAPTGETGADSTAAVVNPYAQMNNYQNPELAQLNLLMGDNGQSGNKNNAMLDMLPYMLSQGKNGAGNYSPQVVQSIIMNSMMTDVNFNMDKDK